MIAAVIRAAITNRFLVLAGALLLAVWGTWSVLRTPLDQRQSTLTLMAEACGDAVALRVVASDFASVWRRALPFHLGQAPLSLDAYRRTAATLREVRF